MERWHPYRRRAHVRAVVDGDTLEVDIDLGFRTWRMGERIRIIGINAPETRGRRKCDAGLYVKQELERVLSDEGNMIWIESEKDAMSFERWLCHAYLLDGTPLIEIIQDAMDRWSSG